MTEKRARTLAADRSRVVNPGERRPSRPEESSTETRAATLEKMARPFEFSDDDDVEPTRPAAIFTERLAYWDAHDANFSTADAEDELPAVLAMRKR